MAKHKNLILSIYSYAEVRAERRRELGIEESLPETAADKVCFLQPLFKIFHFLIICERDLVIFIIFVFHLLKITICFSKGIEDLAI